MIHNIKGSKILNKIKFTRKISTRKDTQKVNFNNLMINYTTTGSEPLDFGRTTQEGIVTQYLHPVWGSWGQTDCGPSYKKGDTWKVKKKGRKVTTKICIIIITKTLKKHILSLLIILIIHVRATTSQENTGQILFQVINLYHKSSSTPQISVANAKIKHMKLELQNRPLVIKQNFYIFILNFFIRLTGRKRVKRDLC